MAKGGPLRTTRVFIPRSFPGLSTFQASARRLKSESREHWTGMEQEGHLKRKATEKEVACHWHNLKYKIYMLYICNVYIYIICIVSIDTGWF